MNKLSMAKVEDCQPSWRQLPLIGPPRYGDDGARTRDLVVANHALSQLSYIPLLLPTHLPLLSGRTWIRTKDLSFIRAAL